MATLRQYPYWLVLIALVGCRSAPAHHVKELPLSVPQGWTAVDNDEAGIALAAPSGWHEGSGFASSMSQTMNDMGMGGSSDTQLGQAMSGMVDSMAADEKKAEMERLQKLAEEGKFCHCVDSSKPTIGEQMTRFYVQRIQRNSNADPEVEARTERENLKGIDLAKVQNVQLPIGPATRLENKITTIGGDEVYRIAFVTVDGKNVYILRFVTTGNGQTIQSIADDVAKTLRIRPTRP